MPKFIEIYGKRDAWKDIVRLRRKQIAAERHMQQPTLFEVSTDSRPASQQTARGRYEEPTLFKVEDICPHGYAVDRGCVHRTNHFVPM